MNIFNLGDTSPAGRDSERATEGALCSRKGCRAAAQWQLLWNNPRIHTPDRRKVWLSCGEHREWLEEYLQTRGLWKETLPFAAHEATVNEAG
ncbi:hypothetical protein CQ020_10450 [Arthrobacter sp. MYb23]|uniref:hypothetical protein n=1 Tax=unclassified Arthrobacter TaxID=235627 RepID=UPI000CFD66CE|nr:MULTISPECIES: hypothetical protein [unclassified Arthrobacter]PRB42397.1 hypothetical protein CQ038_10775 [Arthrobacter sp. MYb51]PRB96372.1 hypothetical protein CQ020_10450 [Arthrobacter sp. MYb23]